MFPISTLQCPLTTQIQTGLKSLDCQADKQTQYKELQSGEMRKLYVDDLSMLGPVAASQLPDEFDKRFKEVNGPNQIIVPCHLGNRAKFFLMNRRPNVSRYPNQPGNRTHLKRPSAYLTDELMTRRKFAL